MSDQMQIPSSAWIVDQGCKPMSYFPERHLVDWLARRGEDATVIGFEKTGVQPLRQSYEAVVARLGIDTIIPVDGGTNGVIKGDEALLGTVEEDAASIVTVDQVVCDHKFLICLGFGIGQFHGICHHSFLKNTAELIHKQKFPVCVFRSHAEPPNGTPCLDAVDFLNDRQRGHKSIVLNSIASAIDGEFGNYHRTQRTAGSELFINTLMSLYW
jgi:hypothetical protein